MEKKSIAILFGGISAEYEISLQSAHAVITHLDTNHFVPVLVGITKEGHWFRYRGNAEHILHDTWCDPQYCTAATLSPARQMAGLVEYGIGVTVFTKLDAAFPVMHGTFGEDGTIQGLLELAGIPIVGCDTLASAACMDKDMAHRLVNSIGICVPKSTVFTRKDGLAEMRETAVRLGYPVFVKPVRAGSSFGISKVSNAESLADAVATAFEYDTKILLEECIEGFEVGCAVLGKNELTVGELDEVELAGGFFDYTEKYSLITSKIHVPARVPPEKTKEIKAAAMAIYRVLGCSGFARVDLFFTSDRTIVFNEVNTIPGFTAHSRYPTMMKAAGLDFGTVVNQLVEMAVGE